MILRCTSCQQLNRLSVGRADVICGRCKKPLTMQVTFTAEIPVGSTGDKMPSIVNVTDDRSNTYAFIIDNLQVVERRVEVGEQAVSAEDVDAGRLPN